MPSRKCRSPGQVQPGAALQVSLAPTLLVSPRLAIFLFVLMNMVSLNLLFLFSIFFWQQNAASAPETSLCMCSLESVISKSWQSVREALIAKVASDLRQREAALAVRERAAEEATTCSLCMEHPRTVAFNCGHQTCSECAGSHSECPFCREPIMGRIVLFQT